MIYSKLYRKILCHDLHDLNNSELQVLEVALEMYADTWYQARVEVGSSEPDEALETTTKLITELRTGKEE